MNKIFFTLSFFTLFTINAQNPHFDISKQMEIYNDMLKTLSTNYIDEINFGDMIQKSNTKMLNGLDRFTTYYDEEGILLQKMRQAGYYGGMGIAVKVKDSLILITKIFKDTPAAKQGLQVGDKVLAVDGKYIYELSRKVASNLLRGEKGSSVELLIERNNKQITKNIERDEVPLNAVTATELIGDIGYIRFVKFNQKASSQTKKAILDLKAKGAQKIIIDLRGNPGGLLSEVVKIVNFFVPKGKIVVTTKGRFEKYNKTYSTKNESVDEEIPLAILVDNHSASASEILSGSLQDYDRAVIIGDTTYGKGLVQRTFKLKYGTYMKQTISKYYIPSGRLIQKIDYWHRDKNGKPMLMSDNLKEKDFKTANGRTVHNLGGVIPDIVIETETKESLIKYLIRKNILFDFATWYYYNQPKPENADSFVLKDHDFELFIKYLQQHDINPKSTTEIMLTKAYEKAEKDNLDKNILSQYQKLLNAYTLADEKVLRRHKAEILDLISRDLVHRYFYIDGFTTYVLKNDKVVQKAIEVLNNPAEYKKILGK
jgi:carboxyl-terminal processing protease